MRGKTDVSREEEKLSKEKKYQKKKNIKRKISTSEEKSGVSKEENWCI